MLPLLIIQNTDTTIKDFLYGMPAVTPGPVWARRVILKTVGQIVGGANGRIMRHRKLRDGDLSAGSGHRADLLPRLSTMPRPQHGIAQQFVNSWLTYSTSG